MWGNEFLRFAVKGRERVVESISSVLSSTEPTSKLKYLAVACRKEKNQLGTLRIKHTHLVIASGLSEMHMVRNYIRTSGQQSSITSHKIRTISNFMELIWFFKRLQVWTAPSYLEHLYHVDLRPSVVRLIRYRIKFDYRKYDVRHPQENNFYMWLGSKKGLSVIEVNEEIEIIKCIHMNESDCFIFVKLR